MPSTPSAAAKAPGRGGSAAGESPVRLHVVTGKGGTGKTTVAAALALALASTGRRVLLTEVENRQGIAQLFDTPPLPYQERRVSVAPGHGEVFALAIDPEQALLDYLDMFYNLRSAGKILSKFGAVDFATTIAPGIRDVLLTGKLKEVVDRKGKDGQRVYDAVVVDAPPTGRVTRFLNVTEEVGALAKMGPIKSQSDSVQRVLHSPQTAVHLVTLLEEMPVQETVDGVAELTAGHLPVGHVIINMRRTEHTVPRRPTRKSLAEGLAAAGLPESKSLIDGLLVEAGDYAERAALETQEAAAISALKRPMATLPLLAGPINLGALYRLAESLRAQGLGPPLEAA